MFCNVMNFGMMLILSLSVEETMEKSEECKTMEWGTNTTWMVISSDFWKVSDLKVFSFPGKI